MNPRTLAELMRRVAAGETAPEDAALALQHLPYEEIVDARIDHHRELRTGAAEAVYAPGKTPEQVRDATLALVAHGSAAVFVTRADAEQAAVVTAAVPGARFDPRNGLIVAREASGDSVVEGTVAVVAAGTSDLPVADEAAATTSAMGMHVERITDVGVAGIQRVLDARERLTAVDCVIVVAGMEGALPSVISGLVGTPVIAVPTSIGYGAAFDGMAALLGMLSACAPGVATVNIDNGFGAAHIAQRICRTRGSS